MDSPTNIIGFLGGGQMSETIIRCLLKKKFALAQHMWVTDPSPQRIAIFQDLGVNTSKRSEDIVDKCHYNIICVKPAVVEPLLVGLRESGRAASQVFLSIAAGISIERMESYLPPKSKIIRAMPNLAAFVGESATVYTCNSNVLEEEADYCRKLLNAIGIAIPIQEEYVDLVTGLSGSGPAYVFMFMEALADAGTQHGLPRDIATKLVMQTVYGSVKTALERELHFAQHRNNVESPGGTTLAAVATLEKNGFRHALFEAVSAAIAQARELSKSSKFK